MADTDFFDDDLRESTKKIGLSQSSGTVGVIGDSNASDDIPVRPVSDFNLTRMAKHKQEVDGRVATAMQELEKLRSRQEDLEREKRELEEIRRKQDDYDRGKREMMDRLTQSIVTLEKDEVQAERLVELLSTTRKKFKNMLAEIEDLRDESWPEDHIRDELNRALVVLDEARVEYNKSMSRIEAVSDSAPAQESKLHNPVIFEERPAYHEEEKGFGHWLKVGFAVSLPVSITLIVLAAVMIFLQMMAII